MVDSRNIASAARAVPDDREDLVAAGAGDDLARPRSTPPSRPSISGSSSSPESVAEAPLTTWRNSGRKLIAPNMATPMMKLTDDGRC